jgi:hypothetical protein
MENVKDSQLGLDICDINGRKGDSMANLVSQGEMESAVEELKNTLKVIRSRQELVNPWSSESFSKNLDGPARYLLDTFG